MSKDIQEAIAWLSALDIHSEYEATNKELILNYIENSIPTEVIEKEIENIKEEYKNKYKRMRELERTIGMSLKEYEELNNLRARVYELDIEFTTLQKLLENK